MKALFYSEHGSVDVLRYDSQPDPVIGSADVLIQVAATAINRLDIVQRNGWFTLPGFALPQIAGMDMAGTVVELGGAGQWDQRRRSRGSRSFVARGGSAVLVCRSWRSPR